MRMARGEEDKSKPDSNQSEIVLPAVESMVEYTGETLEMEEFDAANERLPIPPSLVALLSALPPNYAARPLEAAEIELLCERRVSLPSRKVSEGAVGVVQPVRSVDSVPVKKSSLRPARDVYASRVAKRISQKSS